MRILVACEESQAVCKAFRSKGHEAYSCDLIDCSGGHPEWHIKGDCVPVIKSRFWDMVIFHPVCTAMSVSGNRWYGNGMPLNHKRHEAIEWTLKTWFLIKTHSKSACLENPVSVIFSQPEMNNHQYIQPWQFGHGETKRTCLWLKNLPPLVPTDIVEGREQKVWKMSPGKNRGKERSRTYTGIAKAMADQWGKKEN